MARSLDLPEEVKAKLDNPRAKLFTTLECVFDSSVGREYLKVEPDSDHGLPPWEEGTDMDEQIGRELGAEIPFMRQAELARGIVMDAVSSIDIDTLVDFNLAEVFLRAREDANS